METQTDDVPSLDQDPDLPGTAGQRSGSSVLAFVYGLSVAILGGMLWAAIYIKMNLEVGILAWAIGGAVGGLMIWIKKVGSVELAISAVFCALLGLASGKVLSYEYGFVPQTKKDITQDPEWMETLMHMHLKRSGRYSAELFAWRENPDSPDHPPEPLIDELNRFADEMDRIEKSEDRSFVDQEANYFVEQHLASLSTLERYDITVFDLIWLTLALGTAWQLTSGRRQRASPGISGEDDRRETG